MPRLNSRGQVVASGVNSVVSVDRVPIDQGGYAAWLDDNTVIYQQSPSYTLMSFNVANGEFRPVHSTGANALAAGGGEWAAWLAGVGLYDALADEPAAGLAGVGTDGRGSMSPEGALAVVPDRQHGYGLELRHEGVVTLAVPGADARSVHVLSPIQAIWVDGGALRVEGLPKPKEHLGEAIAAVRAVWTGSEWLLLLTTDTRLILRHWNDLRGKVVVAGPTGFHADAVRLSGHIIRVASSRTVDERPEDIEVRDFALADLTEDLSVTEPQEALPRIDRPTWFGFFVGTLQSGGGWTTGVPPDSLPGNCWLTIPAARLIDRRTGTAFGQYVEGRPDSDSDAIDRAIAEARARSSLPALAYWPRKAWARVPAGAAWVLVEAYRLKGETSAAFERALDAAVARCQSSMICPQCFTSNADLTEHIAAIPPVVVRVHNKYHPRCIGILGFNGSGRGSGLQEHPDVLRIYDALARTVPSAPPLLIVVKPQEKPPMNTSPVTLDFIATQALPQLVAAKAEHLKQSGQIPADQPWVGESSLLTPDGLELVKTLSIWFTRLHGINETRKDLVDMVRYERNPEGP